jgi:hypothetical protein
MTWKAGSLLIAIVSAAVRLAGDQGAADFLAMTYLTSITLHLVRSSELRTAVRTVRS